MADPVLTTNSRVQIGNQTSTVGELNQRGIDQASIKQLLASGIARLLPESGNVRPPAVGSALDTLSGATSGAGTPTAAGTAPPGT